MKNWRGIVVHHTAGRETASVEEIGRYHVEKRGYKAIGYHFLIRRGIDGWIVETGRSMATAGAHCPGANRTHIGVAVAGDWRKIQPPEDAMAVLVMLLTELCATCGIDPSAIIPHCDRRVTECPGMIAELIHDVRDRVSKLLPVAGAL